MGTLHLPGMPPLFDLILDCHGVLNTERVEAVDADAAWRAGLMVHLGKLKGVVQLDEGGSASGQASSFRVLILSQDWIGG